MIRRLVMLSSVSLLAVSLFAADKPLTREDGNLSSTTYKNPFYGLALTLPTANRMTKREIPAQGQGVHALLAVKFEQPYDEGALTVFATDASSGLPLDPKQAAEQQKIACEKQGMSFRRGPFELVNVAKSHTKTPPDRTSVALEEFNTPTGEFMVYLFFKQKDDLITVVGAMKSRRSAGTTLDPWWVMPEYYEFKGDVKINYEGPAPAPAPEAAMAPAKLSAPLPNDEKIDGQLFSSAALGMRYGIPQGWKTTTQDLFAQFHPEPSDAAARATHDLLKACSSPLLNAEQDANGGPTLTVLVADPACLHLQPTDMNDMQQVQATASTLAQFSDFGKVAGAGILSDSGASFIELKGTLPDARSQVAFITPRNGDLVMLFFTAKDISQIDILPNAGMSFDPQKK